MSRWALNILYVLLLATLPRWVKAQESKTPLCYEAYQNGTVVVTDGPREVVRIIPHLFAGKKIYVQQAPSPRMDDSVTFMALPPGKKAGDFNARALLGGGEVDLRYGVERLAFGLHFHYLLVPRANLQVGRVQVYAWFSYFDWRGLPVDFNDNEAPVPDMPEGDSPWSFIFRKAYSSPVSMGPSPALGGLAVQMGSKDLFTELVLNQRWGQGLGVVYTHHEFSFPNSREPIHLFYNDWVWEQGVEKVFDFTMIFNRPMAPSPCVTVTPAARKNPPAPASLFTPLPAPSPTRTAIALPTPTRRATPTPGSTPTWIPLPSPTPVPTRPTPPVKVQARQVKIRPTPAWVWRPTVTHTPEPTAVRRPSPKVAWTATPKPTASWLPPLDKGNSIEFSEIPPNIYVSFADGPGFYRLKIVDSRGNLLQVIYDQRVVSQTDAWVGWDGKDAQGQEAPPGQYFVIFYKDGKALKSLSVVRTPKAGK